MTDIEFTITDAEPEPLADPAPISVESSNAQTSEFGCEVCGAALTYSGRGRKPKRCEDHKRKASTGGTVRSTPGRWQQPLADALHSQFAMIGVAVTPFNQFDGMCIIQGSENLATSLVGVAETNPKVRDALQKFVQVGAWSQVAAAVAAIAIPIMQNHKVIPQLPIQFGAQPKVA